MTIKIDKRKPTRFSQCELIDKISSLRGLWMGHMHTQHVIATRNRTGHHLSLLPVHSLMSILSISDHHGHPYPHQGFYKDVWCCITSICLYTAHMLTWVEFILTKKRYRYPQEPGGKVSPFDCSKQNLQMYQSLEGDPI